jgi:short-subunit dehydrogenase
MKTLITGAASGIGRACALEMAKRGYELMLVDIDGPGLEETADELRRASSAVVELLVADLSRAEEIDRLAREALRRMGHIDVLFNNAGVAVVGPLSRTSDADWEWIFAVNTWAPIRLVRAMLPSMIERRGGQIVITASLAGLVGAPGMPAYSTTKFALVGFSEALRYEVAAHGIDVTVVCPGYVRTNLHRATRYRNAGFERFMNKTPAWYGMSAEKAARIIVDGIESRRPMVVLGLEKIGWWLKRIHPSAASRFTRWSAKRAGIL